MKKQISYLIKHNRFVMWVYIHTMSLVMRFFGFFYKTDDHLVLLNSYGGDSYNDSPRVLFEKMLKDPRFKGYKYVWAFNDIKKFKVPNAEIVKIDSFNYFKTALKAKVWISNVNIERGLHFKKPHTIYINSWHGTGPKKGGNAVPGRSDYDFSCVDIFCADGEYTKTVFQKYWNMPVENMLFCGRPREDELFELREEDKKTIREELNITDGKKVVLYMPTWREKGNKGINHELWEKKLGHEYVILTRSHHFANTNQFYKDSTFWIDCSEYPDVNKLYFIADYLISDYSSAFFDYGLLGKPILSYGYDYEEEAINPGFFMNFKEEFPNGLMKTEEELLDLLLKMNYAEECGKVKDYVAKYVSHPVNATEAVLSRLYEILTETQ